MNQIKKAAIIVCLSVLAFTCASQVKADDWNKETKVTFSQAIEIPGGITLPAGTYVFKLMNSSSNRHIVQIFSEDKSHIYATILAIPNYRLQATDKTVMTFGESAVGVPQALRAWFYPGANSGEEFVYPKRRAMELAKAANLPILAMPAELETAITQPAKSESDEPIVALKAAPVSTINPTGEEVAIAQDNPSLPNQAAVPMPAPTAQVTPEPAATTVNEQATRDRYDRLPQTASLLPLVALLALLSLGLGLVLAFPQKMLSVFRRKP